MTNALKIGYSQHLFTKLYTTSKPIVPMYKEKRSLMDLFLFALSYYCDCISVYPFTKNFNH